MKQDILFISILKDTMLHYVCAQFMNWLNFKELHHNYIELAAVSSFKIQPSLESVKIAASANNCNFQFRSKELKIEVVNV